MNTSASTLNNDLMVIQDWAYQWKKSCNPTKTNRRKRPYFLEKSDQLLIHHFSLMNLRSNFRQPRNTLG